jgi:hypothetical protein
VTRQLHQQEALLVKLLGQLQHVGVLLDGGATRLQETAGKLKKDLGSKVGFALATQLYNAGVLNMCAFRASCQMHLNQTRKIHSLDKVLL